MVFAYLIEFISNLSYQISKVSTNKIQQWEDLVIYFGYIVYEQTTEANINWDLGSHLNISLLLVCLFLNDGIILILY
jgi:hypothetical protein